MMRADNDHAVGNSVESWKDESKIPENRKNNNNMCELFYDTRSGGEWGKESGGNVLDCHSCGDSNEGGKKIGDTSVDFSANGDSLEKVVPVFFMEKNVTVCDLPEIVVCYKENTYHVVKDICVDEGVPVQEKFLFGEKGSVKCSSDSKECGSEDLMKAENTNVGHLETKSSEETNSKVYDSEISKDCKTDRSVEDFADVEGSSNCNQVDLTPSAISLEFESDENPKNALAPSENVIKEALTLGDILSREIEQKPLKDINNTNRPEEQSPPQLQEKEKRSLETTGFDTEEKLSSDSTTTSRELDKTCNNLEKPATENQQQNYLVKDLYEDDKLLTSGFGETSFSAAEADSITGHITYSGPIAFAGSLSVRSDTSTTSGRSFAFPILQTEWNSSPVRMAKADKRRQKGWRQSLLCCRFS